jgi:hypothetical protein
MMQSTHAPVNKNQVRQFFATGKNVNNANTDINTFSGLPSKYRVVKLTAYDASIDLTTATVSLRTASGGGGTAIVNAQALSGCSATTKFADLTLAVTADYQTSSSLTLRNDTAQGAAATCSFCLEIVELV